MGRKLLLASLLLLSSCANNVFVKPGITQDEANQDQASCELEKVKVKAAAAMDPWGSIAYGDQAYDACMRARGYRLQSR